MHACGTPVVYDAHSFDRSAVTNRTSVLRSFASSALHPMMRSHTTGVSPTQSSPRILSNTSCIAGASGRLPAMTSHRIGKPRSLHNRTIPILRSITPSFVLAFSASTGP